MARLNENRNYFTHDSNARNSEKLIKIRMRHGAAGYGVFFMIIERLREEPNYMSVKDYNIIAFDLRVDASLIKSVVEDFGLFAFTEDGKCFYSESLLKRMTHLDDIKKIKSEAGKKGAQTRWGESKKIADGQQFNSSVIAEPSKTDSNIRKGNIIYTPSVSPSPGDTPQQPENFIERFFAPRRDKMVREFCEKIGLEDDAEFSRLRALVADADNYLAMNEEHFECFADWCRSIQNIVRANVLRKQSSHENVTTQTHISRRPAEGAASKLPVTPACGVKRRPGAGS